MSYFLVTLFYILSGSLFLSFLLSEGFYVTASDEKTPELIEKYGEEIFRLTDKNFTRIIRSHVRKELTKHIMFVYL